MCRERQIYGAKDFLIRCTYNNQTNFFFNPLERKFQNMYTFTYLTLFTFTLEPTEPGDVAKTTNFLFGIPSSPLANPPTSMV